ncbi:MAG: NAD(P)H-dependent oxidoreductase [Pseudomonadota bacterium]
MYAKRERILLINGHPGETNLSRQLLDRYFEAATTAGKEVRRHNLAEMQFDVDFGQSDYQRSKPLEPVLQALIDDLVWSQHVVLASPLWWGGLPAKLKGLFDRILLPGHAFDPRNRNILGAPAPLLKGRTARLILTADTARWELRWFYGDGILKQLRRQVFAFVGIRPMHLSYFGPVEDADGARIQGWEREMERLGSVAG